MKNLKENILYFAGTIYLELADSVAKEAAKQKRKLIRGVSRFGKNIEQNTIECLYKYNKSLSLNTENPLKIKKLRGSIGNILGFKSKLENTNQDYKNSVLLSKLLTKYSETLKEEAKLINITEFFKTEDKTATQYAYRIKSDNLSSELAVATLIKPITNCPSSIDFKDKGVYGPGLNGMVIIDNDLVIAQYNSLNTEAQILIYDLDTKGLKNCFSIANAPSFDKVITHHLSDSASKNLEVSSNFTM